MSIKISPLDSLFSLYIRTLARWKCERCGKQFTPPTNGLHCSHYHGRRKKSVRFDPENADAICYGCHQFFGEHREDYADAKGNKKQGYTSWKINKLGKVRFDLLTLRANTPKAPDYGLIKIWLKEKLNEFDQ